MTRSNLGKIMLHTEIERRHMPCGSRYPCGCQERMIDMNKDQKQAQNKKEEQYKSEKKHEAQNAQNKTGAQNKKEQKDQNKSSENYER